jgi:hypothetical protein
MRSMTASPTSGKPFKGAGSARPLRGRLPNDTGSLGMAVVARAAGFARPATIAAGSQASAVPAGVQPLRQKWASGKAATRAVKPMILLVACRQSLKFSSVSGRPWLPSARGLSSLCPSGFFASPDRLVVTLAPGSLALDVATPRCIGSGDDNALGHEARTAFVLAVEDVDGLASRDPLSAIRPLLTTNSADGLRERMSRTLPDECFQVKRRQTFGRGHQRCRSNGRTPAMAWAE